VDLVGAQLRRASHSTNDRGMDDVGRCAVERWLNCDVRTTARDANAAVSAVAAAAAAAAAAGGLEEESSKTRQRLPDRVV
jgi:hypothetical protein